MSTTQLNQSAIDMMNHATANGLSQGGYNALISAASLSSFFAGELNAAADKGIKFSIGKPNRGTVLNGLTMVIDPNWMPGGTNEESPNIFATTIAHELGHATLLGGYGYYVENVP